MTIFNAAIVQMRSGTDMARNISEMSELVRQAASEGAHYVQTPEMTGLVQQNRKEFFASIHNAHSDPTTKAASALAQELGIVLHIGSTPIALDNGRAANRALVFDQNGSLSVTYDKIHMFDVDLDNGESWRESAVYDPGHEAVQLNAIDVQFGLTICYDLRFPELHKSLAQAGVEVLTGPSCFTRQTGQAHWHALLRSRAIENGAFMIAAAQGGDHEDGRSTFGHSLVINPWGEVIAEINGEDPGIALVSVNTEEVVAARAKVPNLKNGRAFSLKNASLNETAA